MSSSHGVSADTGDDTDGTGSRRVYSAAEFAGEFILLFSTAGLFLYIVLDSIGWIGDPWPLGAALTPWLTVAIGVPFLVLRVVYVVRVVVFQHDVDVSAGQIMDIGFDIDETEEMGSAARLASTMVLIGALFVGIWLTGVHIAIPVWTLAYMQLRAKVKFRWSLLAAVALLAMIVVVYDQLSRTPWPDPVLFRYFGWEYFGWG